MSRTISAMATLALVALALLASAGAGASCSAPDEGVLVREPATSRAALAPFESAVSVVFEKRCGSLDCHGTTGRNLRVYSSAGLRLPNDAGLKPGGGATTTEERIANYHALLDLEPERTRDVLAGDDPYEMLILKKPLGIESHKGGAPIRRGDDAETCIVSWLEANVATGQTTDLNACGRAAIFPKE